MEKFGDARLEVINERTKSCMRVEGMPHDVIFAWMQLTTQIAESVHVPLPYLLAQCAALGPEFEKLNHAVTACRIDLSRPIK